MTNIIIIYYICQTDWNIKMGNNEGKCEKCSVRQFNSLKALDGSELVRISHCKTSKHIRKGTTIFNEGEYINGVYCIKKGVCKLTKLSPNGKSQIIRFARENDILGYKSIISKQPVNLTAVVIKDLEACFIPKEEISQSFNNNAQFSTEIIKGVCDDLRKSDNIIVDMAQKTVRQRLADALLYLEDTFGTDTEGCISIQLSREEISNMIGTATESLIRMLSEFNKKKLIETRGKQIQLINRKKLLQISEGL